jgi:hypothetical protein
MCVAAGNVILKTIDGGAVWRTVSSAPNTEVHADAVSCPSISLCFIAGDSGLLIRSEDGGATWQQIHLGLDAYATLTTVVCGAPQFCVVAGTEVGTLSNSAIAFASLDGGARWFNVSSDLTESYRPTSESATQSVGVSGGACSPAQQCFLVGYTVTADDPQALPYALGWSTTPARIVSSRPWGPLLPDSGVGGTLLENWASLSCPSVSSCFGGGPGGLFPGSPEGFVAIPSMVGTSRTLPGPPELQEISSVACISTTECLVGGLALAYGNGYVGGRMEVTFDGGAAWQQEALPGDVEDSAEVPTDIVCPAQTTCYAAAGVVLEGHGKVS